MAAQMAPEEEEVIDLCSDDEAPGDDGGSDGGAGGGGEGGGDIDPPLDDDVEFVVDAEPRWRAAAAKHDDGDDVAVVAERGEVRTGKRLRRETEARPPLPLPLSPSRRPVCGGRTIPAAA